MRPALHQIEKKEHLVGAEIGVDTGDNAKEILNHLSIAKLYLVDPYIPFYQFERYEPGNSAPHLLGAIQLLSEFKEKIVWLVASSFEASHYIEDKTLDFVYIDGNHQYEYVKADIRLWLPKIKKGGLIGGHDYGNSIAIGIKKAVDEAFGEKKIKTESDNIGNTDWWIFKK